MLDSTELFHLALREMEQGSIENTMVRLKACLEIEPTHAHANYLLGSAYAELGIYDRAVSFMQQAITLDDSLTEGRFHLGMLHLAMGDIEQMEVVLKPLDDLGQDHYLVKFKQGISYLAKEDFERCVDCLQKGISLNDSNPALNHDMENIMLDAQEMAKAGQTPEDNVSDILPKGDKKVLSAYGS